MPNDWELLQKFAREKDQGAFRELVERHIDMVHGIARRLLGASAGHADDAVQGVFLLLSQRAGRISPKGSLAGWLFRATRYCCANIRKSEDRRQRYERESAMEPKENAATNEE
ncbi:MAG: sigma-70 family RNA polymerase sigma factor, partial [Phycisphaerales bacterium]|nr:sigma-70 family RNA polymerase sigma factor [Phycisphaerales bacterium]